MLLRPGWPPAELPWLPLLAGLAVRDALRLVGEVEPELKWPNDLLLDGRKVCGLLAEVAADGAVVLGVGLNVTTAADELPHDQATSLRLAGAATTDRDTVLRAVLRELRHVLDDPAAAREAYRERCGSVGRRVRVELPAGRSVEGTVDGVDERGRLVVDGTPFDAGDVVHLR